MGFLSFEKYINRKPKTVEESVEYDFFFESVGEYTGTENVEKVDELLYEYVCNYKDDEVYDELSIEELWDYIQEDDNLSKSMKDSLGKYIDVCEESIEDTFKEL